MLLSFCVVMIVVLVSGVRPSLLGLLCLPAIMVVEYVLALGFALITSAVTVYFRDLEHILGIVSMAWMYATPICYSEKLIPEKYNALYHLNPMTPIIEAYRSVLYEGTIPHMTTLIESLVLGVLFLVIGIFVFRKLNRHFAEEL